MANAVNGKAKRLLIIINKDVFMNFLRPNKSVLKSKLFRWSSSALVSRFYHFLVVGGSGSQECKSACKAVVLSNHLDRRTAESVNARSLFHGVS